MSIIEKEWEEYRADKAAGIVRCGSCKRALGDREVATQINPEGGHGRPRFLMCDGCLEAAEVGSYAAEVRETLKLQQRKSSE